MEGKSDMNKTIMQPTKNATERYIDFINENILPFVDYERLHTSYRTDIVYAKGVLNLLHEAMIKVYGDEYLDRHDGDEGFVTIPGVIKGTKTGNICLALLDLDLSSSGEHWGTHFLCKYGIVEQGIFEGQDKRITELVGNFYQPYEYCYTASISVDHHVDEDTLPRELKSILSTFRKYNAELTRPADISEQDTGNDTRQRTENMLNELNNPQSGQNLVRVLVLEPGKEAYTRLVKDDDEAMQAIIGGKCDTQHWHGNMEYLYSKRQYNTDSSIANRNIRAFIFSDTVIFRAYHSTPYSFNYISLTDEQTNEMIERFGKPEQYMDEQLARNKYLRFPDSDAPENLDYIMDCMRRDIASENDNSGANTEFDKEQGEEI